MATTVTTSNGIIAGYIHSILPGMVTVTPYQSEMTTLTAHWTDFQSYVPIVSYEWALKERNLKASDQRMLCKDITDDHSSYVEASGFELVYLDTKIEVEGLSLQHGVSYFVTVRTVDQAIKCIATSSHEGLLANTTGPLAHG